MLLRIVQELLLPLLTAIGVVIGGSIVGSFATILTTGSPLVTMTELAGGLRLWAIVATIGGTFHTIRVLESGIFNGNFMELLRQLATIVLGFAGAHLGYWIIIQLTSSD